MKFSCKKSLDTNLFEHELDTARIDEAAAHNPDFKQAVDLIIKIMTECEYI